jgi:hypothetical protein
LDDFQPARYSIFIRIASRLLRKAKRTLSAPALVLNKQKADFLLAAIAE